MSETAAESTMPPGDQSGDVENPDGSPGVVES